MLEPILVATDHPILEVASWAAQLFLAAIAIIAALVAYRQLNEMSEYRRQRLKIAHAELLMKLDDQWDSADMVAARRLFATMRRDILERMAARHPGANDHERIQRAREEWRLVLAELRNKDEPDYILLLGIGGFLETLGLMVKRGYISAEDARGLFEGSIIAFGTFFAEHIEERSNEVGVPKGFLEHALFLFDLCRTR